MNVYTHADYRRRGNSKKMVEILIDEAKENGVTEISLDATEMGRPLYQTSGFQVSDSCMVMDLKGNYWWAGKYSKSVLKIGNFFEIII